MKLTKILAVAALMVAGVAHAGGYTEFQLYDEENRNTKADNIKFGVVVGNRTADKWDYSLKMETSQAELGSGSIGQGIEGRVRKGFSTSVMGITVSPYIGVRLGEKISSSENFSYYAVDTGVKFPLVSNWLTGDVGYRYRNAFSSAQDFDSHRGHVAVAYAITKNDSISVRYSQSFGAVSEEKNSWRLAYSHSF